MIEDVGGSLEQVGQAGVMVVSVGLKIDFPGIDEYKARGLGKARDGVNKDHHIGSFKKRQKVESAKAAVHQFDTGGQSLRRQQVVHLRTG